MEEDYRAVLRSRAGVFVPQHACSLRPAITSGDPCSCSSAPISEQQEQLILCAALQVMIADIAETAVTTREPHSTKLSTRLQITCGRCTSSIHQYYEVHNFLGHLAILMFTPDQLRNLAHRVVLQPIGMAATVTFQ
jgi:hypothetical protein